MPSLRDRSLLKEGDKFTPWKEGDPHAPMAMRWIKSKIKKDTRAKNKKYKEIKKSKKAECKKTLTVTEKSKMIIKKKTVTVTEKCKIVIMKKNTKKTNSKTKKVETNIKIGSTKKK